MTALHSCCSTAAAAAAAPHHVCAQRAQQRSTSCWVLWLLLLHTAQTAMAAAADTGQAPAAAAEATRVFIDEGYFLEGDTEILRAFVAASNGRMTISGESTAAFLSVKGYYVPDTWDVYWTIRQACQMAYKHMQPQQLVNCMPGVSAMSLKRPFVSTWQQAYGELAFGFIPRSYLLPQQYWLWRSHLLAAGSPADRLWVLKANIHRGKGVSVMPQSEALSHALAHKHDGSSSSGDEDGIHYLHILVQSYLQQQLVIAGRSSYLRVWLLVTSINPLRAYLFDGGFAIFGKQKGSAPAAAGTAAAADKAGASGPRQQSSSSSSGRRGSSGSSTDDLIVNLWTQDRNSSHIWSLQHLKEYLEQHPEAVLPSNNTQLQQQGQQQQGTATGRHLLQTQGSNTRRRSSSGRGPSNRANSSQQQQRRRRTFADAWQDMQASAGLVLAAALPAMRAAAVEAGAPPQGMFEYFGIDFVLDAELQPWMLEVNAIPSMSRRKKSECSGQHATAHCKLTTAGAGSAAAARDGSGSGSAPAAAASDEFDAQKEQFVHDMLVLLGLPVDADLAAAAAAGAGGSAQHSTQDAASWLRMAAAAAAAAGIRSPVQPPPPAAAAPAAPSKSNSGSATGASGGSGGKTDRRLLSSSKLPDSLQQRTHLGQSLQQTQQQQQRQRHLLQHTRHAHASTNSKSPRVDALASSSSDSSNSSSGSDSTKKEDQWGYKGVTGLQWSGPAPDLQQLPQLQKLLCKAGSSGGSSGGSSSGSSGSTGFACITCLTADDLAALSAAEAELQRAGRFVPVHNLIAANSLNQQALKQVSTAEGAAGSDGGSPPTGSGSSASANTPAAAAAAAGPGTLYLSQSRSVWQRLYRTWKGLSTGHVRGVRDLAVMKYYTTASTVHAKHQLQLQRVDYVMSAWLRVRRQEGCEGLKAAECVVKRLGLLTSTCYL